MSKIIKFAKLIRRNWKKSTVLFGLVTYGVSYGIEKYQTLQMMRAYCEEAKVYGEQVIQGMDRPRHITVLLNPEANDKKSSISYEKFAAPLFHLAGFKVSLFQTEGANQARDLMSIMENTDAVIIAGGNGTLHEAITGYLNRSQNEKEAPVLPIGIVPVGKTNTVAKYLFSSKAATREQLLAESAMAVIRETTVSLDVMKIQPENEKPLFAMSSFEAGIFAELDDIVHKYWYLGPFKDKYVYFKNALKKWNPMIDYSLEYIFPCNGCSQCYIPPSSKTKTESNGRWWHAFIPKAASNNKSETGVDYTKVINDACGILHELKFPFANITISSPTILSSKQEKSGPLWVKVHPENLSFFQFISSGIKYQYEKTADSTSLCEVVEAGQINISNLNSERTNSIDSNSEKINISDSSSEKISISDSNSEVINSSDSNFETINTNDSNSEKINISDTNPEKDPNEQDISELGRFCFIDKEKYKMKPYQITVLPKKLLVYGLPE